jgi:DNA-binding CsgD family transcriptional regulator
MTKPIPKSERRGHYNTRVAPEREAAIYRAIGEGRDTNEKLMADTGLSKSSLSVYMRRLMQKKKIYIAAKRRSPGRGTPSLVWAQGNKPNAVQINPRRAPEAVIVVKPPLPKQEWCSALFAAPVFF